jgi:predicted  nucleic acid-binding Zn-ribbon protein
MDPLDVAQKFGSTGAWSVAALFLSISAYLGIKSMAPVWAERYKAQTKFLTERDVKRGEDFVRKLNGRVYGDIERHLIASTTFRERFASAHLVRAIDNEQDALRRSVGEHAERMAGLEAEMRDVKDDVREIKADLKKATEDVTREAKAMRQERYDGERAILNRINELFERRAKERTA